MGRVAALALLTTVLPMSVVAQSIQIATLGGFYRATPGSQWDGSDYSRCPNFHTALERQPGVTVGGRLSLLSDSPLGLDATIQRSFATNRLGGGCTDPASQRVAATFIALRPHVRLQLEPPVEVVLGAGPTLGIIDPSASTSAASQDDVQKFGFVLSMAIRARVTSLVALEVATSWTRLGDRDRSWSYAWNHWHYGLGLAYTPP